MNDGLGEIPKGLRRAELDAVIRDREARRREMAKAEVARWVAEYEEAG